MITTRGFQLAEWQEAACKNWQAGPRPYHGTLEIFTGGGKTLIALQLLAVVSQLHNGLSAAIVVPTEALARQWVKNILRYTSLTRDEVGMLGAGSTDSFNDKRVIVSVINSASRRLPEMVADPNAMMLIVDECHRAGAPSFSRVLTTPAKYRLGLSATPDREEVDESGELIEFDEQIVGKMLGEVVFRFSLKEARDAGWLPEFDIHHHGVAMQPQEQAAYEQLSRKIDDLADRLQEHGIDPSRARAVATRGGESGQVASAYVAATAKRKDVLYRAAERHRVTERIVRQAVQTRDDAKVLLFHERVDEAERLFASLQLAFGSGAVGIEHSRLAGKAREEALQRFRDGKAGVLVSVKSLVEGIDVPDADVGVSVAASSSVRQRIQSLGRVLRRRFGESPEKKHAVMHLIYVADSVDDAIYGKENWSDLTGEGNNFYWRWPLDPELEPESIDSPPRIPLPTEEEEWKRLGESIPSSPVEWFGAIPFREYSVDTRGNVRTPGGTLIANTQHVDKMVTSVRGRPGGRFYVTPLHRLVIVRADGSNRSAFLAGRLDEPFALRDEEGDSGSEDMRDADQLRPTDVYGGPSDKTNGTYKLSQKSGGVIQRKLKGGITEFALTSGEGNRDKMENAVRLLESWKTLIGSGITFHINSRWHAWYAEAGEVHFLGAVPEGFAWPSDTT